MAMFVLIILIIYCCLILTGSETSSNAVLEIRPSSVTVGQNVVFYKVEDTLNLTCILKNDTVLPKISLEWEYPELMSNSRIHIHKQSDNFVTLIVENLQVDDSGDYKCRAVHNGNQFFESENTVKISVKNKKRECKEPKFQCPGGECIQKRYTCDGRKDCPNGEDESPAQCGPGNPCDNKLMCPDRRCIPVTWCCELYREPNCTTKVKHGCCTHVEKFTRDVDHDLGYQYEQHNDIGFLQTTVYTVIGCAMAFMFIVTVIVIAICRVRVRRTFLSRCPAAAAAAARNLHVDRDGNVYDNQLGGLSFYDLDLYFNRTGFGGHGTGGQDLMSVNPLLVTYNINNGVQFVGRPVDPPPYCEIVTSPTKEGPPPSYTSHEDLTGRFVGSSGDPTTKKSTTEDDDDDSRVEVAVEPEVTESDRLLSSTPETGRRRTVVTPAAEDGGGGAAAASGTGRRDAGENKGLQQSGIDIVVLGGSATEVKVQSPRVRTVPGDKVPEPAVRDEDSSGASLQSVESVT